VLHYRIAPQKSLAPGQQFIDKHFTDKLSAGETFLGSASVIGILQGAAEKSGSLNFFAVFSATVWDFDMKFYSFIYGNLLHLTVK